MLATKELRFEYLDGPSFRFPDMVCGKGEHLLIIGESGTGKTTLLHLLAGMLRPREGKVIIDDQDTTALSDAALDKFRGSKLGIVFQTAHFIQSLSVEDNLIMPQYLTGRTIAREHARKILDRLNIGERASVKPASLSVGEQQRAAIARAVINNPSVILADEPTSALDDKNANEVINLLEEQARETGASLIIVTHDKRLKDRFSNTIQL
jgi:ABC-type lipoprotein export system ATPase subunit